MSYQYTEYESMNRNNYFDPTLGFYYIPNKTLDRHTEDLLLSRLRWHEELEIKYFISGSAEILCGPKMYVAQPGDIVVINSCEMHGTRLCSEEPAVYHLLMIPSDLPFRNKIAELVNNVFNGSLQIDNHIQGDHILKQHILELFNAVQRKEEAYSLEALGHFTLMLSQMIRNHSQSKVTQPFEAKNVEKNVEKLRPAIEHIYQYYYEDIRTETLAKRCSLSVYYFCRLFHQCTGCTVSTFINQFRLSKAAELLRSTDTPIALIANSVGFADECYFSRCFHKWCNSTPSTYRKAEAKKQNTAK